MTTPPHLRADLVGCGHRPDPPVPGGGFASISGASQWLRETSPFLHIAPAPAAEPDWTAAAWLVGLGFLAALAGVAAFGRRDLQGA